MVSRLYEMAGVEDGRILWLLVGGEDALGGDVDLVGDIDLRLLALLLITLARTRGGREESLSACNSSCNLLCSGRWGAEAGLGKATRPP